MTILAKWLKESKLTNQQYGMADYFLKDEERIGNMFSMDVAREIGVSDALIIRFSRVIGYKGFTDLKNDIYNFLAGEASTAVRNMQLFDRFDVLSGKFNDQNIPGTSVELMNYNITRTSHQNPMESYDAPTDVILVSRRKYIIGLHGCMGVTGYFTRLLGFAVNQAVTLPYNGTEAMGILQDIGPEDVFILFSLTRYYKIDMFLTNVAKSYKVRVRAVIDSPSAPTILCSDILFIAETSHMSFFNLAIGVEMIGEYIVILVCRKDNEEYRKRAKERDAPTTRFRIP